MERLNGESMNVVEDNIDKLKSIFPEIFEEGKISLEKFEELIGNYKVTETERYNFTWPGKSKSIRIAQTPSTGTLRPCKEESKDWNTTQNIYIEGDNLEVLKLLQKSYYGKVKMIYIDPPYNTGNDFVYKDDFKDNIENYLKITGQKDAEDNKTTTNTESNGRYHSNWLNMMYPRLKLSRNLLKDDGVIFISIDDIESDNLRKICDEVFGEKNFIARLIHKNNSMKNQSKYVGVSTEYVLVYSKDIFALNQMQPFWRASKKGASDINNLFIKLKNKGLSNEVIRENIMEMYSRPKYAHLSRWNKVDDKGVFKDADLSRNNGPKDYTIINPHTGKPCQIPKRGWGKSYDELLRLQKENLIWYGDENTAPGKKSYLTEDSESVFDNFIFSDTSGDKKMIDNMIGTQVFEFPKSLEMIKQLISLCTDRDDIILDFFSGSGTTAHAVLELNAEKGTNKNFIMVQIPEVVSEKSEAYKAGYNNICEIGKERIRRAGDKIKEENKDKEGIDDLDIGFKVFKLDSSNINRWDSSYNQDLEHNLLFSIDNIKEGRNEEDILYEVLLKYGIDLNMPIEEHNIAGKKVFDIGFGAIIICLDDNISLEVVEGIGKLKEELAPDTCRVVFMDNGFNSDSVKTNAVQILKRFNIEDVKSI